MATQVFLIPQQVTASGIAPEYSDTHLSGKTWIAMPYGIEGVALVATDPNPALAAEADVLAFPVDLTVTLADIDVTNSQSFFAKWNIPASFLTLGMSWAEVAKSVAQVCQIAQRYFGLTGSGLYTSQTAQSLQAAVAAVQSGQAQSSLVSALPVQAVPQTSSQASLGGSQPTANNPLGDVAASFNFTHNPNADLETAITSMAEQFTASLQLSRGDGFTI